MTPTFRLVSGNDSIELMNATGALYAGWRPVIAPYKSVYADSSMADERRLVYQRKNSAIETVNLHVRAGCQDDAIDMLRRIESMLQEVRDYWTKPPSANLDPVYIRVKAANETNYRYAILLDGRIDDHANPFAQPFFGTGESVIESLTMLLERGQWSDKTPGDSDAGTFLYAASSLYNYLEYDAVGDFLNCGDDPVLENLVDGGFTVDGWFRINDQGGTPITMGLVDHTSGTDNWRLSVVVDANNKTSVEAIVYGTANAYIISAFGGVQGVVVPTDQWAHIVMQIKIDLASLAFTIDLFVDGTWFGESTIGNTHDYDETQDLYIGNHTSGTEGLDGDIKWARITDGELYTERDVVGSPINLDPPAFCDAPPITGRTIGQWEMSEGTGATVDNATGLAALDGTITNAAWGVEAGCSSADQQNIGEKSYVAGFDARVAITDAYRFDATGSTWSGNLIGSGTPYLLYPEPVATGDFLYIGNSGVETDGPFCSAIFDMGSRIDDGDWSVSTPQYYTGAAWANVSGVGDETDDFATQNVSAVSWELPSDWAKANLNGLFGGGAPNVNGWWIRFPVVVSSAPTDSPEQKNSDIYTANVSGVTIPSGTVSGDIGAIGAITSRQINGAYDSMLVGSRFLSDGDPFVPFIHTTNNVHNHAGITVSGDGSDTSSPTWPSGEYRSGTIDASTPHTITITLDDSVASYYAGRFRALCVVGIDVTDEDDVYVTLSYKINDVDISISNSRRQIKYGDANAGEPNTIDVGEVNISQDPGNVSQIIFDILVSAEAEDKYRLYALILLPADGDMFLDSSNPATGIGSKHVGWGADLAASRLTDRLTVDHISSPVSGLKSFVTSASGNISANYVTSTPSGVVYPIGESALWFVFYNREPYSVGGGGNEERVTGPHITNAISYTLAQLYRLMRGTS